jgi:uncharacterized Zn finger protein
MPSVADLVAPDVLAARAGEYLQRAGEVLRSSGQVRLIAFTESRVTGEVADGDKRHEVELAAAGHELSARCDCPTGRTGTFCPHAAAVAIEASHRARQEGG